MQKGSVLLALIIPIEFLAAYYAGVNAFALAGLFAITAFLGIHLLIGRLSKPIVDFVIAKEAIALKKSGSVLFLTTQRFRKPFEGFDGFLDIHIKLLYVLFLFVLFVFRSFGAEEGPLTQFWKTIAISVALSFIIAPLAIPYWLIYSTRVRILNPKHATIDRVGRFLRAFYRWLLGVANVVALLYLFIDAVVKEGFPKGALVFSELVALIFGSVGVGSLIATVLLYAFDAKRINEILYGFEESVSKHALPPEEVLEILKGLVIEEEGEKILKEEAEGPKEAAEGAS